MVEPPRLPWTCVVTAKEGVPFLISVVAFAVFFSQYTSSYISGCAVHGVMVLVLCTPFLLEKTLHLCNIVQPIGINQPWSDHNLLQRATYFLAAYVQGSVSEPSLTPALRRASNCPSVLN